ncbi:hypothetical protein P154DRAFT_358070 [Amniculicola lignicola CBS 123094]|uniref:Uncharacterized protein n=1 Tax=Amniculicola lignicola CBS 123094 TaxID=1392246 RepID=A0A6A5WYU3_9PLEO|nr:hypothetical protein P154DRAFT_358070 [Amniculicola lignicola CBS 123094]
MKLSVVKLSTNPSLPHTQVDRMTPWHNRMKRASATVEQTALVKSQPWKTKPQVGVYSHERLFALQEERRSLCLKESSRNLPCCVTPSGCHGTPPKFRIMTTWHFCVVACGCLEESCHALFFTMATKFAKVRGPNVSEILAAAVAELRHFEIGGWKVLDDT